MRFPAFSAVCGALSTPKVGLSICAAGGAKFVWLSTLVNVDSKRTQQCGGRGSDASGRDDGAAKRGQVTVPFCLRGNEELLRYELLPAFAGHSSSLIPSLRFTYGTLDILVLKR